MEKYHLQFVIISREPLNCFIYFFSSFESYCYAYLLVQFLQIDHLLLDADLDLILILKLTSKQQQQQQKKSFYSQLIETSHSKIKRTKIRWENF